MSRKRRTIRRVTHRDPRDYFRSPFDRVARVSVATLVQELGTTLPEGKASMRNLIDIGAITVVEPGVYVLHAFPPPEAAR